LEAGEGALAREYFDKNSPRVSVKKTLLEKHEPQIADDQKNYQGFKTYELLNQQDAPDYQPLPLMIREPDYQQFFVLNNQVDLSLYQNLDFIKNCGE